MSFTTDFGKCDLCDEPAVQAAHDVQFDGTEPDSRGELWERWRYRGPIRRGCVTHIDHARGWKYWSATRYQPVYGLE